MGRTDCTEPQCLYKGDLYRYFYSKRNVMLYFNMIKVKNSWSVTSSDPIRFQGAAIIPRGQVAFESPYHYGYLYRVRQKTLTIFKLK